MPNEHDIEATTCGLPRRVTADTPLLAAAVDNVPSSLAIVTESDALMRGLVERLPPLPTYAECCRDDAVLPEYSAATTRNDIGRLSSEGASNRKILETESVKRTLVKTAGAGNTAFETNCALANSLLFAPNDDKIEPDLAPLLVKNKVNGFRLCFLLHSSFGFSVRSTLTKYLMAFHVGFSAPFGNLANGDSKNLL